MQNSAIQISVAGGEETYVIISGVLNDVFNGSSPPLDMQTIDIYKCFDEMWFQETHNDLFDVKVTDDKFALICGLDVDQKIGQRPLKSC